MPLFESSEKKEVKKEIKALAQEGVGLQLLAFNFGLNESEVKMLLGADGALESASKEFGVSRTYASLPVEVKGQIVEQARALHMSDEQITGFRGPKTLQEISVEFKGKVVEQARALGMSDEQIAVFGDFLNKIGACYTKVQAAGMTQEEFVKLAEKEETKEFAELNKQRRAEAEAEAREVKKQTIRERKAAVRKIEQYVPKVSKEANKAAAVFLGGSVVATGLVFSSAVTGPFGIGVGYSVACVAVDRAAKYKKQARQNQQEAMHQAVPLLNHDGEGVEEASVVEKSKKSKPAKKGKGYGQLHNEEQLTDAVSEPVSPSALSRANSRSSLLA